MTTILNVTLDSPPLCSHPPLESKTLSPNSIHYPLYHISRVSLVPGIDDKTLSLLAPIISFWAFSLFFHLLDSDIFQWPAKYRIHETEEIKGRNLVSRKDVILGVLYQQIFQSVIGLLWLDSAESNSFQNHTHDMMQLQNWIMGIVGFALGERTGCVLLSAHGQQLLQWLYWWGIPIAQFSWCIFVMDTWQYFLHRAFHLNKTLYKHVHSVHHRLYVPYAYGAIYNHPVEGFLSDTIGTLVAQTLSCLTIRQATFLFAISTMKSVDDHCGYALPWDPFQALFGNNADYHDIHHQTVGIKSNFSQPYFLHWDVLLGTRMTREDIDAMRHRSQSKVVKTE